MKIRDEDPRDHKAISDLTTEAFKDLPYSSQTEAAIVDALREAGALAVSLVAEDGEMIGHVAFSPVKIDGADIGWYGLGPVSVSPDHQGKGIGAALVREGLARLQNAGAAGCVVLGSPDYYTRFGFEHDPELKYSEAPAEYFMRLVISGEAPAGEVAFHPGFAAT